MNKKEQKVEAKTLLVKEVKLASKGRKAWKVDLKWLFGILAVILLTVSLVSFAVYRVASNPELKKLTKNFDSANTLNNMLPKNLPGKTKGILGQPNFRINLQGKWYSPEQLNKMSESEFKKLFGDKAIENFMRPVAEAIKKKSMSEKSNIQALGGGNSEELGKHIMSDVTNQTILLPLAKAITGSIKKNIN